MNGKAPDSGPAAQKLKTLRESTGLSVRAAAAALGKGGSSYRYYEVVYKKQFLPMQFARDVARVFQQHGVDPGEVMALAGICPGTAGDQHGSRPAGTLPVTVEIAEAKAVGVPSGAGHSAARDVERARWELPEAYVAGVLGVKADRARIREVRGDSMAPTLLAGDRVMVNLDDRNPAQGGIFEMWDGLGMAVKRLEVIRDPDPILRVICDNPSSQPYRASFEEIEIVGRVIWFARRI